MDDTYRSQFRLPYPLYEQLKAAAEKSGRSLNAELVFRLSQSLSDSDTPQGQSKSKSENLEIDELAEKLAHPQNRAALKTILATLTELARKDMPGK